MKNFGLLVLGIILGALAMYFYCCQDTDLAIEEPTKPSGLISSKEAKVLDEAYNIKHRIINDSLFKKSTDGGDNRSSWWSIEDIQNYINHAENQAGELGYTMDGLRVYLGAYPQVDGQEGLTTMFIVPTGTENKSKGSIFSMFQDGSSDIQGADGLNVGGHGKPPSVNYPQ
ncbi:hypothetical protein [Winogradskyella forsetii]|uniref:hypothetical protein n=1 Tax=Winogradskyella forsetii TaxID=2686077 RepID=UPI0015BFBA90|nr:hypothetical protein [Winogradskyella forsetii]